MSAQDEGLIQELYRAAVSYTQRGWRVIPVPFRSKNPGVLGWQQWRIGVEELPEHFNGQAKNIGLLTGEPSGWVIDVDLDHVRCIELADQHLPPTPAIFGRPGKPKSHRLYQVSSPVATKRFKSKSAGMLVEVRSTGAQTIVPPSTHEGGEPIAWIEPEAEPAVVDPDELLDAAARLAEVVKVELGEKAATRTKKAQAAAGAQPALRLVVDDPVSHCLEAMLRMEMADHRDGSARLFAAACRCVEHGLADEPALAAIREYSRLRPFPAEWTDADILRRLRDAEQECRRGDALSAVAPPEGPEGPPTQSAALVALASRVSLWHTPDGEGFATVQVGDHFENHRINGKPFRRWLSRLYYQIAEKPPSSQPMQDALAVLSAKALFDGPEHQAAVRLTEVGGVYYLDLADREWRAVQIDESGWRVLDSRAVPAKFIRPRGLLPLPMPVPGGDVTELRRFINVGDESQFTLLLAWLAAALRPTGPYPVLTVNGEQGSAKSSLCRVVRALVDPNIAALRAEPREVRDLMIAATNGWVCAFDNITHIPPWLSDCLCRLATGGGFSTRELFSDSEEKIFDAMRPVLLNGVEEIVTRPDLLDRAVPLTLAEIPDHKRRCERELWSEFEEARPAILGALLDAVSTAMRNLPSVELPSLPRMADFAVWAVAAEPALGDRSGSFLAAYGDSRRAATDLAIESSIIGPPLLGLMSEKERWTGTAKELLAELSKDRYSDERTRKRKEWPASGKGLAGAVRRLAADLRRMQIQVTFLPRCGRGCPIQIERVGVESTPSSPSTPTPDGEAENTDWPTAPAVQRTPQRTPPCTPVTPSQNGDSDSRTALGELGVHGEHQDPTSSECIGGDDEPPADVYDRLAQSQDDPWSGYALTNEFGETRVEEAARLCRERESNAGVTLNPEVGHG